MNVYMNSHSTSFHFLRFGLHSPTTIFSCFFFNYGLSFLLEFLFPLWTIGIILDNVSLRKQCFCNYVANKNHASLKYLSQT